MRVRAVVAVLSCARAYVTPPTPTPPRRPTALRADASDASDSPLLTAPARVATISRETTRAESTRGGGATAKVRSTATARNPDDDETKARVQKMTIGIIVRQCITIWLGAPAQVPIPGSKTARLEVPSLPRQRELAREILEESRRVTPAAAARRSARAAAGLARVSLRVLQNPGAASAPRLTRELFEELGATFVKLGQLVASSPTIFPEAWTSEFEKTLDGAPPVPFATVKKVVEKSLGKRLSAAYATFDETPLATASVAQVHAATLRGSGRRVVVKVLKPDVRGTARDLRARAGPIGRGRVRGDAAFRAGASRGRRGPGRRRRRSRTRSARTSRFSTAPSARRAVFVVSRPDAMLREDGALQKSAEPVLVSPSVRKDAPDAASPRSNPADEPRPRRGVAAIEPAPQAALLEAVAPETKRVSLRDVAAQLRDATLQELDLREEAARLSSFSAFLDDAGLAGDCAVPTPVLELSSEQVLTMERFDGSRLVDATAGPDAEAAVATVIRVWARSVVEHDFFHADVHGGNVLLLNDGRVGLIDFGIVGTLPAAVYGAVIRLAGAFNAQPRATRRRRSVSLLSAAASSDRSASRRRRDPPPTVAASSDKSASRPRRRRDPPPTVAASAEYPWRRRELASGGRRLL